MSGSPEPTVVGEQGRSDFGVVSLLVYDVVAAVALFFAVAVWHLNSALAITIWVGGTSSTIIAVWRRVHLRDGRGADELVL